MEFGPSQGSWDTLTATLQWRCRPWVGAIKAALQLPPDVGIVDALATACTQMGHVPKSSDTLPAIADRLMGGNDRLHGRDNSHLSLRRLLRHRSVQQSLQSRPELLRQQRGGAVCSRVQRLLRWQRREFQQSERAIWVKKVPKIAKVC